MEQTLKIWGAETPRSFRPIWVAEELGLEYDHAPIQPRTGETQTAEYTTMNGKQKIPLLEEGGFKLTESVAICRYLIRNYPNDAIAVPQSKKELAREDEWIAYIYGELDETALYVMRRHGELSAIYGEAPAVMKSCAGYLKRHLAVLEPHLSKHDYVTQIGFSLPDVLLMSCLDWAALYEIELPESVQAYRERIAQRPAYQKAMQINFPILFGGQS